jgi:hypothetical protein
MTESELSGVPADESALQSTDELASAEDQLWVSQLLQSLRVQDEPIPPAVAQRVDEALNALKDDRAGRHSVSGSSASRVNRWFAVAATAALLVGGTALYRQSVVSSAPGSAVASDSYAAPNAESVSGVTGALGAAPTVAQVTSGAQPRVVGGDGQPLSKASLASEVTGLLAERSSSPGSSAGMAAADSTTSSKSTAWADCLSVIPGAAGRIVTAVIQDVRYAGQSADVLVTSPDSAHLEIWIITAGCSSSSTTVLDHELITS